MPLNGKKNILKLKPQPTQINAKRERRTKRQTDEPTDRWTTGCMLYMNGMYLSFEYLSFRVFCSSKKINLKSFK